jgi:4-hydroxybenzoate polyprenyltransferase
VATPSPNEARVLPLPARRTPVGAALVSLRPRQWPKNLLVFAGIVFAAELGDPTRWVQATVAFVAYCAASSAAYLVNDVRDAADDRVHPLKRTRPIARGELGPRPAIALAAALAACALALTAPLGLVPLLFVLAFATLQLGYSFSLKHLVVLDVMTISGLFVVRAAAGAAAVDVRISPWLLLCTALLALFLGLAKRRGELVLVGGEGAPARPVLAGYSLELVDQLVGIVAACTIIAYSLYTFTADEQTPWMMVTIPFVVFGIFRYLLLVHRRDLGEEPEAVLLSDVPILVCVALWTLAAALILSLT